MRVVFLVCVPAFLLALVVPSQAQNSESSLLPTCAQECVNKILTTPNCDPLSFSGVSCACRDTTSLATTKDCFATSCGPKDALRALNVTTIACNEPARDKSKSYRILNVTFFSLAVVAMAARWTANSTVGRMQWLNEVNMFMVLALNIVLFATCFKMSYTGLGQDLWKIPFEQITFTLLYFWISEVTYFFLLAFIKIAFLLFFLQIFPDERFRRTVWGLVFFNLATMVAFGLAAVFICSPVSFVWNQWDGEHTGTCRSNNSLAFSHAAFSILIDFVTLSLPIPQIWNLQLGAKKKIGVLLMFSVGAFVTAVSIIRLQSLVHFANTTNVTWDYLEASLWSIIECQVGIICACMPSIRHGLARLFPKVLGSTAQSTSKSRRGATGPGHSEGNTQGGFSANAINVQTSFRVSHARKAQVQDEERSFVQLVEIDGDARSAAGSSRS